MARPSKKKQAWKEEVEDAAALVNQVEHNQKRIALRSRDDGILYEVADSRRALEKLRDWLHRRHPHNETDD